MTAQYRDNPRRHEPPIQQSCGRGRRSAAMLIMSPATGTGDTWRPALGSCLLRRMPRQSVFRQFSRLFRISGEEVIFDDHGAI